MTLPRGVLTAGMLALGSLLVCGCGRTPVPQTTEIQATLIDHDSAAAVTASPAEFHPGDWTGWRGPRQDGVAFDTVAPTRWSDTQNVVWKSKLPGRGHSSPIVIDQRIYLATADDAQQVQSVLAVDRRTGKWVWQTPLFSGNFEQEMHQENSQASSTLAFDGKRLFVTFLNDRRIWCSALTLEGEELWRQEVGGFRSRFGYSASPIVAGAFVIIAADHEDGGFVAALDRGDGNIVWRRKRQPFASYATPRLVTLTGRDQIVLSGGGNVTSFDPQTGKDLWSVKGTTTSTVGTPVVSHDLVICSGGHPDAETLAIDGKGSVVWRTKDKCYVTSPLAHQGHLYLVQDDGIAKCLDARTGKERWRHRIGGRFRTSPVLINDRLYVTDMNGKTTVFAAAPGHYEQIAENQLGNECFASPAVSEGQLFLRIADNHTGFRTEWLYCLADATTPQPTHPGFNTTNTTTPTDPTPNNAPAPVRTAPSRTLDAPPPR